MKMKIVIVLGALLVVGQALPKPQYANEIDAESTRIVQGVPARQGEFPYQLALWRDNKQHCGASLIKVQGILVGLTAAHCTANIPVQSLTVVGGDLKFSDRTGLEQVRKVVKVVNHEGYKHTTTTVVNDIALVFFNKPFEINTNVAPIRLPEARQITTGDLRISGWGAEREKGPSSDILQKAEVPVIDDQTCAEIYASLTIYNTFLCAGSRGRGTCQGDSGGPAVSSNEGYLAGVVSWGAGCDARYPGVYTEVSHYIDWISKNVAKHIAETQK